MDKQFVVPAVSFIAGLLLWVAFYVSHVTGDWIQRQAPWLELAWCLVVGGLIVYSAVRCRLAGGPRVGAFVRTGVLLVMAFFTLWKVGIAAAGVLAVSAIVVVVRVVMAPHDPEAGGAGA